MAVSVSNYSLRTVDFSEEDLKSILSYSVGFNPRLVKMEMPQGEYAKVKLEEKMMGSFAKQEGNVVLSEENINIVIAQLDSLAGSGASGNVVAERAAAVIRELKELIKAKKE